ncbi:MAG: hypothetical protein ACYTGB_18720, partial [Planctomycetota bacterium]|jgi:hypothetical protein
MGGVGRKTKTATPAEQEAAAQQMILKLGLTVAERVEKLTGGKPNDHPLYVLWGRGADLKLRDKQGLAALDHAYLNHAPVNTCLLTVLCSDQAKNFQARMLARMQNLVKAPEKVKTTEWEAGLKSSSDGKVKHFFTQLKALTLYRQVAHNVIAAAHREMLKRKKQAPGKPRPPAGAGSEPKR